MRSFFSNTLGNLLLQVRRAIPRGRHRELNILLCLRLSHSSLLAVRVAAKHDAFFRRRHFHLSSPCVRQR